MVSLQHNNDWLGVIVGNTRVHWASFRAGDLRDFWHTAHLEHGATPQSLLLNTAVPPPAKFLLSTESFVLIASVVAAQTSLLMKCFPKARPVTLQDVRISGLYDSMGVDRALSLLGAGLTHSFPVLVIDCGTALTFTGANEHRRLVGGAILAGLGLQRRSLAQGTAALPEVAIPDALPERWARNTAEAIRSGLVYGALATIADFVADWEGAHSASSFVLTGGDAPVLLRHLQQRLPSVASRCKLDNDIA